MKSRDRIVGSGLFSGTLTLVPEASWAPMVCVVVYCVQDDGEVINGVLMLPVPLELQNQVSLWSSQIGNQVSLWSSQIGNQVSAWSS